MYFKVLKGYTLQVVVKQWYAAVKILVRMFTAAQNSCLWNSMDCDGSQFVAFMKV